MKDVELNHRLLALGLDRVSASRLTRDIRDIVHPVAATAAIKASDHVQALGAYQRYGEAGLDGYEYDELSGIFKKIKKAAKKVVKTVGKAAAVVAPVVPVAAVVAAGAMLATKSKSGKVPQEMRSGKAVGSVPYQSMSAQQLQEELRRLEDKVARGKDVKLGRKKIANVQAMLVAAAPATVSPKPVSAGSVATPAAPGTSGRLARGGQARVPRDIAQVADTLAAQTVATNGQVDVASLMQSMLANQGQNFVSPQAQDLLSQVAAEGVDPTGAAPASIPWVPIGIGVGGLGLLWLATRRK